MSTERIRLIALDLDGTLTQHRSPLEEANRRVLDELRAKYSLLMVGAGGCRRIHRQMRNYPIDIIGNYGMEVSRYNAATGQVEICRHDVVEPDRPGITERVEKIRRRFDYTSYTGETVEFHDSGMVTIPLLGTAADIRDKLAFDPTREKRRSMYPYVTSSFPEYTVFVGGSSSFDLVPAPFDKCFALEKYCGVHGIDLCEVVFFGDDWEPGGGDRQVYTSGIRFVIVDDYRAFGRAVNFLLE
mgnify:CR=1 FL=1|jgi:hydroxymethylpyrimidine pyrophosphatase-like HAD family hydrolase